MMKLNEANALKRRDALLVPHSAFAAGDSRSWRRLRRRQNSVAAIGAFPGRRRHSGANQAITLTALGRGCIRHSTVAPQVRDALGSS